MFGSTVFEYILEVELLEKKLDATKRKLQEANRRIEHLDDLQKIMNFTDTELNDAPKD